MDYSGGVQEVGVKAVDVRSLKRWAVEALPRSSQLRAVLQMEEDSVCVEEYVARIPVWLALLDLEFGF